LLGLVGATDRIGPFLNLESWPVGRWPAWHDGTGTTGAVRNRGYQSICDGPSTLLPTFLRA
jgi:hypothetical protein